MSQAGRKRQKSPRTRPRRPSPRRSGSNELWLERLYTLRDDLAEKPHDVGSELLRLMEDWLYEQALAAGLADYSGMREYVEYLTARSLLNKEDAAALRRYIEVRNCLAHRAGLLISPAFAQELVEFAARLFRGSAPDARHLMSPRMVTAQEADSLRAMRNRMLNEGISRIPVMRGDQVIGVLSNRDLLAVGDSMATLTVGEAVQADSLERIHFVAPDTPHEQLLHLLRQPHVAALLVTSGGQPTDKLLGIITVVDLLPKV